MDAEEENNALPLESRREAVGRTPRRGESGTAAAAGADVSAGSRPGARADEHRAPAHVERPRWRPDASATAKNSAPGCESLTEKELSGISSL